MGSDNKTMPAPDLWVRKEPIAAEKLNQGVNAIRELQKKIIPPPQQTAARRDGATAAQTKQFQVVAIYGDYVTAYPYAGAPDTSALTYIAKPYQLRNSITLRNGRTYSTFTNASGEQKRLNVTDSETQVVIPTYLAGDLVYATTNIIGGTDVTISAPNGNTQDVIWVDDNRDGRAWAKKNGT